MSFKKAEQVQARLRLALVGPSGAGKTMTALRIAKALGKRVAVIDSERGSAVKYARVADFDVLELDDFAPANYVRAIRLAEREGYDVIVVDSLSHAWSGKGGALELVDQAAARSRSGNTWGAWREVTPQHNALVDAIVGARAHVIVTMRAKTEWTTEVVNGRTVPRRVGLAPIQRDGVEYEFDVVADLDWDHNLMVTKTRCAMLDKAVIREPGEDVAKILTQWLSEGSPLDDAADASTPLEQVIAVLGTAASDDDIARAKTLAETHWKDFDLAARQRVKVAADDARDRVERHKALTSTANELDSNTEHAA